MIDISGERGRGEYRKRGREGERETDTYRMSKRGGGG